MAKIILRRKKAFVERFRNYKVFLDGEKIGSIANNTEISFEVEEGKHILSTKIDWNTSNAIIFEIAEDQILTFSVKGANPLYALYYTFAKPHKYLKLKLIG
ncbi:hypothetical protein HX017_05000 [Myroides marinus]|jgi:hypothetical protein|uniref:DUF2846 domain-containing protein n=1 Tax=Myroides marinus TaxID=703342 RepID=A0A165RQR0_9FLAO|nr:hypothetical protein [Myroides marinus]MDR0195741.1 DUF2846 domain-containing protein [Myroides sp.]KUF43174.1 hypothetical protein AS361_09590 [Myroides marinus]KZE84854.1 hypothetical protein AV926_02455 [Myroides marinus]MDM1348643.1 hypothetical protein [Myroides marinus]MDM1352479.1 hypothetical protein [Myroides marinus]